MPRQAVVLRRSCHAMGPGRAGMGEQGAELHMPLNY